MIDTLCEIELTGTKIKKENDKLRNIISDTIEKERKKGWNKTERHINRLQQTVGR